MIDNESEDNIIAKALATEEGREELRKIIWPMISWYHHEKLTPKIREATNIYYEPDYPMLYTEEQDQEYTNLWNEKD